MWKRNLFFIALCALGLAALGAGLQPIHRPAARQKLPARAVGADVAAVVDSVDSVFRAQWLRLGLAPAERADDLTIARRLSLALTGTIPSLEEIRLLEAEPEQGRMGWWLDGLLADRRSHDYLAERLARPLVGVQDGPFVIYRRRRFVAWLADELGQNRPYDQIVEQIIAATGLWTDRPATNFITVTIKPDQETGPDEIELAGRVARAFLGIRMDCAECHDHPFEPWKQSDFQGLAAFFGQTEQKFSGIQDNALGKFEIDNRLTGKRDVIAPRVPLAADLLPVEGTLRQRLASWVTHPKNKAFALATVNRVWAMLYGRALVEPVDGVSAQADLPPVLQLLATDFVEHRYDLRRLMRAIALCAAFQSDSRCTDDDHSSPSAEGQVPAETLSDDGASRQAAAWAVFPLTRLRPEQVVGGLLQAASLTTIDYESHILVRIIRAATQNDFLVRYGDDGADEFAQRGGTIPQRLLMMNGKQVFERTKQDLVFNAATRIALLAPSDAKAVETAYLAVLTRRPTPEEAAHFTAQLADPADQRGRAERLEDLYWTLLNATEFSWNH